MRRCRSPKRSKTVAPLDGIAIFFIKALQSCLRPLSDTTKEGFGRLLGRLALLFLTERKRVALSNVKRVFPHLSPEKRYEIVKTFFENLGVNIVELLMIPYLTDEDYNRRFSLQNRHVVDEALARGRGIIALAFHYSNWEIMGVATRLLCHDIVVLARPLKRHVRLNMFLNSLRGSTGLTIIPNRNAVREVMRQLGGNKIVGILSDQREKRSKAVYVELFGEKVPTNKGICMLGMKTGSPVIPFYFVRQGFLAYTVVFGDPIVMERQGSIDELVYRNTRKVNAFLERLVLQAPHEWFWVHRRWGRKQKRGS